LLQAGDILIDGGNSHFRDTDARIARLAATGIHYTGMGVSGGEDGARLGPSLMPGGQEGGYHELKNILEKIAAQTTEGPCVTYVGNGSAGHYTKMVHNGIEYAIMQLLSEAYAILKNIGGCDNRELHEIFTRWNEGILQSFLVEITAKIFLQPDDKMPANQLLDAILDRAAQKGTGMWTSNSALELHVPTPTIDEAVAARDLSSYKKERTVIGEFVSAAAKNTLDEEEKKSLLQDMENALYFGIAICYVQGLHLLQTASLAYKYEISIAEVVRIWKGGCIIRSAMLNEIGKPYTTTPDLLNLLLDKAFHNHLQEKRSAVTNILKIAMDNKTGTPALGSSLFYNDMFGTGRSGSNLIQAQRDYFGAHTYERTDEGGSFHTIWVLPSQP